LRALCLCLRLDDEKALGAARPLQREQYGLAPFRSKSWSEFARPNAPSIDNAITVCGSAAGEACSVFPGRAVRAHWGLIDCACVAEDEATQDAAFARTYEFLRRRVEAFLALPLETKSVARSLSNAIAGTSPVDVPFSVAAQLLGAVAAAVLAPWLFPDTADTGEK
jgi:hypothetical protein